MERFQLPQAFLDLESEWPGYRVNKQVEGRLRGMDERLKVKLIGQFGEHLLHNQMVINDFDEFDWLYFVLKQIDLNNIQMSIIDQLAETIQSCLQGLIKFIKTNPQNGTPASSMVVVFLCLFFLHQTNIRKNKHSIQEQINNPDNNKQQDKKNTKNAKPQKTTTEEAQIKIVAKQRKMLKPLREFILMKVYDSSGNRIIFDTMIRLVESKLLLKEQDSLDNIFDILELIIVQDKDLFKAVQIKLINLLYDEVSMVDQVSMILQKAFQSNDPVTHQLTIETLQVLSNYALQKTNFNTESEAVKNMHELLQKLSLKMPKLFYNNLSSFFQLFESENYHLRNALVEIITNIIIHVLSDNEQENYERTKFKLIETLIDRVLDKNAFCRSNVLQQLIKIAEANLIPQQYLFFFLQTAQNRIVDVSSLVRKKAIQLASIVIRIYVELFSQTQALLTATELEKKIQEIEASLTEYGKCISDISSELQVQQDLEKAEQLHEELKEYKLKEEESLNILQHLIEYRKVKKVIEEIKQNLILLLGSKNSSDVVESIQLICDLYQIKVENTEEIVFKAFGLIWIKEKSIQEQVLVSFHRIFLEESVEIVIQNLINMYNNQNVKTITSVSEILVHLTDSPKLAQIINQGHEKLLIKNSHIQCTWEKVLYNLNNHNLQLSVSSIKLFTTLIRKNPHSLDHRKYHNIKQIIVQPKVDLLVLRELSNLLQLYENQVELEKMIKQLLNLLLKEFGTTDKKWFLACESVLNLISIIKGSEVIFEYMIKRALSTLASKSRDFFSQDVRSQHFGDTSVSVLEQQDSQNNVAANIMTMQAQLIFIVGHVGLKLLTCLEQLENALKRLKIEGEQKQQDAQKNDLQAQEMEKISGGIEAEFEKRIEILNDIQDREILSHGLIAQFVPWILSLVQETIVSQSQNTLLQCAVLALCKLTLISESFCKQNIHLLFKLLKQPKVSTEIKNNIVVSLGDLLHRFPNIVEHHAKQVFNNLHDSDEQVRINTLMVLTHLILNDMIKIKGEICDFALLLDDPCIKIQGMVKLFFQELHKKDPKLIYNLLPEAISKMSHEQETEKQFQTFIRNIMPYIEKEKFTETLIDKITSRLIVSKNDVELRNLSYCMTYLTYTEKSLRKVIDSFDNFHEKLSDPAVFDHFKYLINKLKKKNELKNLTEEWETRVMNFNQENFERRKKEDAKVKKTKAKNDQQKEKQERRLRRAKREIVMEEESDSSFSVILESDSLPTRGKKKQQVQLEIDD